MRRPRRIVFTVCVALLAVACGDDGGGNASDDAAPGGATTTSSVPRVGGTITMGTYVEPAGLDPLVAAGSGQAGAIEMVAVYDVLMRYDPDKNAYEPRTAESLTSNAALDEWTIKLRPNIRFSDGTPYDAAAVKFGIDRHRVGQANVAPCAELRACPRNATSSAGYISNVTDVVVVDPLTVKVSLKAPWATFAYVLASPVGMIPSPTALKACDAATTAATCAFNTKPVGAGAFTVERFSPKESITMVRNPTYWGGPAYLDGLKFVNLADGAGEKTYDGLRTGQLDVAFLRDAKAVAAAKDAKLPGYAKLTASGRTLLFNNGLNITCAGGQPAVHCAGKPDGVVRTTPPTANVKVRQAIHAAIDPKVIDQRVNDGKGIPTSALFGGFTPDPGVAGPSYDPARARTLVAEAKTAGWDGKVRFLADNSAAGQAAGLAHEAMLEAVGMDVTVDTSKDTAGFQRQYATDRDYDIAYVSLLLTPDAYVATFEQQFVSTGPSNRTGWRNATVDAAVVAAKAARTETDTVAALRTIAEQYVKDAPFLAEATVEEYIAWKPGVRGVTASSQTVVWFDKAWLAA